MRSGLAAEARNNEVFFSAPNQNNQIQVLHRSNIATELLKYQNGTVNGLPMAQYYGMVDWRNATIQVPTYPFIGFRGEQIIPLFWNEAGTPPAGLYTSLTSDPVGDNLFNLANLDIVSTAMTFSEDRIYFSIQNNGGGFPTGTGFTFYSYMPIIVDPDATAESNPIVYGLMYTTTVTGIISPGLYKIAGTGVNDLVFLAPIVSTVDAVNNRLVLSCSINDLLNDSDFMQWYNPDNPRVATTTITSRITLTGGTQEADITASSNVLLKPIPAIYPDLHEPIIEVQSAAFEQSSISIAISYQDLDGTIPWIVEIQIDDQEPIPLTPIPPFEFASFVTYSTGNIPVATDWVVATIRYSDDGMNINTLNVYNTSSNDDESNTPVVKAFTVYPNPARNELNIDSVDKSFLPHTVSIYNAKGQRIFRQQVAKDAAYPLHIRLDDKHISGLYIVKIETQERTFTNKFIKIVE